jgi:hypothetical protein
MPLGAIIPRERSEEEILERRLERHDRSAGSR